MTPGNVSEVHDRSPKFVSFARENKNLIMCAVAVLIMVVVGISTHAGRTKAARAASPETTEKPQPVTPEQSRAYGDALAKRVADLNTAIMQDKAKAENEKQRAEAMLHGDKTAQPTPNPNGTTPPDPAYRPQQAPAAPHEMRSSIAVSFWQGTQQQTVKPVPQSPESDLHALIDAQKAALQETLRAAMPKPQQPVAPVQQVQPVPEKHTDIQPATGKDYKIFEGTLIETALVNRLNGSFTGPVKVIVTSPVYSHDREHVLIPRGSEVLGEAQRVGAQGQQRLAVTFHRIIMPDGYSKSLDKFVGLNQIGETGLKDKVDNHFLQVFGTSIALGLVQGFSQFGTGSALTAGGTDQYRQGVASSIGQSSSQILQSRLNILPTAIIREGHRVRVWIQDDFSVPAYENHRLPGDL